MMAYEQTLGVKDLLINNQYSRIRYFTQVFLLGGWHNNKPITELDSLDPRCNQWFHLPCSALTARQRRRRQEKSAANELLEGAGNASVYRMVNLMNEDDTDAPVYGPSYLFLPTRTEAEIPEMPATRGRNMLIEQARMEYDNGIYRPFRHTTMGRVTRGRVNNREDQNTQSPSQPYTSLAYSEPTGVQYGGAVVFEYYQDPQTSTELIRGWDQSVNKEFAQRRSSTITRTWYPAFPSRVQREISRSRLDWTMTSVDYEARQEWDHTNLENRYERFRKIEDAHMTPISTSSATEVASVSLTSVDISEMMCPPSSQYRTMTRPSVNTTYPSPGHSHRSFLLGARAYHGLAIHEGWIYILGGTDDGVGYLNTAYRFLAETGEVRTMPPMMRRRCYVTAATCLGRIYALGGYSGLRRMSSVDSYSPESDQWYSTANMHNSRSDSSCDTYQGLYECMNE